MKRLFTWMSLAAAVGGTFAIADEPDRPSATATESDNDRAEFRAALKLSGDETAAAAATPELAGALDTAAPETQTLILAALSRLGPRAAEAVPALVELMDESEPAIRACSVEVIRAVGPAARPQLIEAARAAKPDTRAQIAQLLAELEEEPPAPRVPVLVAGLRESDFVADPKGSTLRGLPVAELIRILKTNKDDMARYRAVSSLGRQGSKAKPAVDDVAAVLCDPTAATDLRMIAAWTLGQLGADGRAAEGMLIEALAADPFVVVRAHAAQALGKIGADSPEAIDALSHGLAASDDRIRGACAASLWRLGPAAAAAGPALAAIVAQPSGDAIELYVGICALGAVGDRESASIPRLLELLEEDQKPGVRVAAAFALGRLSNGEEVVVARLSKSAQDSKLQVREAASIALRQVNDRRTLQPAAR